MGLRRWFSWKECLPSKHEDPSSDHQKKKKKSFEKLGMTTCACNPNTVG